MALRIEALSRSHRALNADFQNQHASLVEYLNRLALRHAEQVMLTRTHLALDEVSGGTRKKARTKKKVTRKMADTRKKSTNRKVATGASIKKPAARRKS
ncbi:hypothetical protein WMF11_06510 [Sorangium sp. So ce295]|uniref:hypothetical protein n=1 Tax=Sorangium sp. So ce295 TaxID=3133295 RepID=UPI003F6395B5